MMTEVFEKHFIDGLSFIEAKEEERKAIVGVLATALVDAVDLNAVAVPRSHRSSVSNIGPWLVVVDKLNSSLCCVGVDGSSKRRFTS